MDGDENNLNQSPQQRRSRIPAASTLPQIKEITASENNARAATVMPPPNGHAMKHKLTGRKTPWTGSLNASSFDKSLVPEPQAKRATLVDRAGEIARPNPPAPPSSRPVNSSVKTTAGAGPRHMHSYSTSSTRTTSAGSSRNTSGSSFSSSTSAGVMRPASAQGFHRPTSSKSHTRNGFIASVSHSRPATSLESNDRQADKQGMNRRQAWDTKGRLDDMEKHFETFTDQINSANMERSTLQEHMDLYKTRINEIEAMRQKVSNDNEKLSTELEDLKGKYSSTSVALEDSRRAYTLDMDDLRRKHRNEMEDLRDDHRREADRIGRDLQEEVDKLSREHTNEISQLEQRWRTEVENERSQRSREVQEIQSQWAREKQNAELDAGTRDRETQNMKNEISQVNATLEQEKLLNTSLKEKLAEANAKIADLEFSKDAIGAKINFLESNSQQQSEAFADLNAKTEAAIKSAAEANAKLRAEETLRRKLHNQVQELKGNIRVFCRVRPALESDEDEAAKITYPDREEDNKELLVTGPDQKSAIGTVTTSKNPFSFDRVFNPETQNPEVFEEISQLVQSALDGYNVCIFCYGQTGSGKTYTMSAENGMIPLAVHQIYDTANSLEEKGWKYSMEGSFIEVYNENLNDLLGKADDIDKKKHEIRHHNNKTTITGVTSVTLDSPDTVGSLLKRATANRSVAATKANERSSRSHSVFILKLAGENSITGEKSEGTLNLVDLAGSERLNQSGATGERLKETQNINRSLSCLGDVISALGQGKEGSHIPYRNSKLTYLLQHSLGGNSKTLMFVMISPLQAHLSETLTSLKFATKVHNTHIGTAKKQTKTRD